MRAACDGSHTHEEYKIEKDDSGKCLFSTRDLAPYPDILCKRVVAAVRQQLNAPSRQGHQDVPPAQPAVSAEDTIPALVDADSSDDEVESIDASDLRAHTGFQPRRNGPILVPEYKEVIVIQVQENAFPVFKDQKNPGAGFVLVW